MSKNFTPLCFNLAFAILFLMGCSIKAQRPEKRFLHLMTYDEKNKHVLLFGGVSGDTSYNDLWALKGSTWKKLSNDGPPPRTKSAFVYDSFRNRAVLMGGAGKESQLSDTWEWDGNTWHEIKIKGPQERVHHMAAYDVQKKVVLIFGGFGADGVLSDTWAYDGTTWKQLDHNGPRDCLPHGMVYDHSREKIVMITLPNGKDPKATAPVKNGVWEWTGQSWDKVEHYGPFTSPNSLQALASSVGNGIVLFDGDDITDQKGKTWSFSDGSWTSQAIEGPSPRIGHAMVYDKTNNQTILFGGSDRRKNFNDTWAWDGQKWNELKD